MTNTNNRKNPSLISFSGTCLLLICLPAVTDGQTQRDSVTVVDIAPCMRQSSDEARYACYDRLEAQIRAAVAKRQRQPESAGISIPPPTAASPPPTRETPLPPVVQGPEKSTPGIEAETADKAPAKEEEVIASFGTKPPGSTRVVETENGELEIYSRVASLRQREPGRWLITLENGQVWYQANSQRFNLRKGMEVRIYPSPFKGSYRLASTSIKGFIQVRRVK